MVKKKTMKKIFTILVVVVLTTTISSAQKRTVAIGVGSNLANVAWQDYKLVPVVGYFVTDKSGAESNPMPRRRLCWR